MLIKKILLSTIISLLFFMKIVAQNKNDSSNLKISISKNILVGTESKESQLIEPHVAAHPTNPNHLIAAAAVKSTTKRNDYDIEHCVVFVSKDGGKTWKRTDMTGQAGIDAWVGFSENKAIVSTLGPHPLYSEYKFNSVLQMLVYTSFDGGDNWTKTPQSLGGSYDGPRSTPAKDGSIFITAHTGVRGKAPNAQIFVAKVLNNNYIEKMSYVNPSNLNIGIDGIVSYNDGTLAISFQDYQYPVSGPMRDENGWRGVIKTRREWLITSSDEGQTFSPPKLITESFYDRANDLSVDKTEGKFKDRLYCVGSSTNYESVLFTYSDDKGDTWTDATPIEKIKNIGIRKEPHVAINKDGVIAVSWFDSRDNPESKLCYSPYIAFSVDGGKTFNKSVKVADKKSCVNPKISGENVANRWPVGGDYFGLTATADGRFHIVWPDARSGKFEVMAASASVINNN